jgi:hypothetical protein
LNRLLAALLPEGAKQITYPEGWSDARLAELLDSLDAMGDDFVALAGVIEANAGTLSNLNLDAGWYAQVGTLVRVLNALELQLTAPLEVTTKGEGVVYILNSSNPQADVTLIFGNVDDIIDELAADNVLIQLFSAAGIDLQAILDMAS